MQIVIDTKSNAKFYVVYLNGREFVKVNKTNNTLDNLCKALGIDKKGCKII